jgi:hypothetical protein
MGAGRSRTTVVVRARPLLVLAALAAIAFPFPMLSASAAGSPPSSKHRAGPSSTYTSTPARVPNQLLHRHPTLPQTSVGPAVISRALPEAPRSAAAAVGGAWSFIGPKPLVNEKYCCTNTVPPQPISTYGNAGGRITSLVTDPTNAAVLYAGSAGGGIWKTTDSGSTWTPLTDTQASLAIGALAIDPTGRVIYAGTGEANLYDAQSGQGILKSTDGGATWSLLGQSVFAGDHIGSIAVDRATSGATQRVLVASSDGLFVSLNGGASWTKNTAYVSLLSGVSASTAPSGAVTLVIQDPTVNGKFWLSASDFCRTEGGDILSGDGGSSWARAEPTSGPFSTTFASRIGLAIGPGGTGAAVWLAAAACNGNLLDVQRSSDAGGTWTDLPPSTSGLIDYFNLGSGGQGDYDNVIAIDPTNPGSVVLAGVTALATVDGGAHFKDIGDVYGEAHLNGVVHPDFHAIAFTGADHFYIGNDGGVWSTADIGGARNATPGTSGDWTNLNATLAAIQFYEGTALDALNLLGGSQDNGSPGHFPGAASQPAMQDYAGGDGSYTAIDPTPASTTIFSEYPFGGIVRHSWTINPSDPASPIDSIRDAGPCRPRVAPADPACSDPAAFNAPFQMDQGNPQRLIAATNKVYVTNNGGGLGGPASWSLISPDLTTGNAYIKNDHIEQMFMGPRGVTATVLTGSYGGSVYRSDNVSDASPTWTDIRGNLPAFPGVTSPNFAGPWITGLTFNPANSAEAWATIGGRNVGHVWHTAAAGDPSGTTWTNIDGIGVSAIGSALVNAVALDPASPSTVYAATDFGVMVCQTCGGAGLAPAWVPLGSGLPNVQVSGLSFSRDNQTLFAWTHGRGVWDLPTIAVPAPVLVVSPRRMSFSQLPGGAGPAPQTLTVANDGNAPLTWTATASTSSGGTWLSATPISGNTAADDQSAVTVAVNTSGLSPGTYNGSVAVTSNGGLATVPVTLNIAAPVATATTLHFPALMNSAYGNPGYTTTIYLENTSGSALVAGAIGIVYFDLNGNVVGKGDSSPALASGGVWVVSQNNGNGFPPGGAGSAAVYSNVSLVGFANQEWPGSDGSSYTAIPHPNTATTVYAPAVMNYAFGGYTTGMGITNTGTTTTTVTVTYHDQSGNPAGIRTRSLAANAYWGLYQGEAGTPLPQGFAGTAVLTTNPPAPLAMVVNEVNGNASSTANGQFLTYVGTASGATTLYAPVAFNNAYGGYATGMGIENVGASAATVTITYSGQVGSATATQTFTESFTVPAGGYVGDYNGRTDANPVVNPLPDQFHGSATITSTQPLVEIVNEIQKGQVPGTSYNTFASGSSVVRLPLVENGLNGFSTGMAVENVGSGTATVTITYADPSTGNQVGTSSASPLTLAPGQFAGIYQGPGGDGGVPSGTRATATLTASGTGVQLAVIVNQRSTSSFMSYNSQ